MMNPLPFLKPRAIGWSMKNLGQGLVDKITGAPSRPVQVAAYVKEHATHGDPQDVLATVDRFAREVRWLMNIGPDKGPLIAELGKRLPPNPRILELGAYCGYSSIMMASTFGPGSEVVSIEVNQDAVESCRSNVEVAGLSAQISFLHGPSGEKIADLEGRFDMVFLDHWKDLYKSDLMQIEERGLIGPGSIVVADNVGDMFSPDEYLGYVRGCGHYDNESREAQVEYTNLPDAVEISVYRGP